MKKYYFICESGLTVEDKEYVSRYSDSNGYRIGGVRGILFSVQYKTDVLCVLKRNVSQEFPIRNNSENNRETFALVLEGQDPSLMEKLRRPFEAWVEIWGEAPWSGVHESSVFLDPVKELLVPCLNNKDVQIVLNMRRNGSTFPSDDSVFWITIWNSCAPSGKELHSNGTIFGCPLGGDWEWFRPTGVGVPIIDPDGGKVVAELIDNVLYVLPPLWTPRLRDAQQAFRRILEEVVVELSLTPQQRAERDKKREEQEKEELRRHHEVARSQYIRLCQGRMNAIKKAAEQTVTDSEQSLSKTQAEITNSIRELSGSQRKLAQLEQILSTQEQKLSQTYDSILQNPMVEEVTMRDGETLRIKTKELTFTDPSTSKLHLLGKFHIEIPVNGGNVRFFNLDRTIDGLEGRMQAPCVTNNGCTMLSNATQAFPELIANYDFDTVVQLALQVPCTIEPSEEYAKYANKWPEVQQQVPSDTAPVSAA